MGEPVDSGYSNYLRRIIAVISILLCFSISAALLLAHNQPADGYEFSIYSGTLEIIWSVLFISMLFAATIIISSFYCPDIGKMVTYVALAIAILSFCSIISLLIIRGYVGWTLNGDTGTHLHWLFEILDSGMISFDNPYPILHVISAELILITDLDVLYTHLILPFLAGALTPIFYYVLANQIFNNRQTAMLVALLSMLLSQGWFINFTPNHLANLVLPLMLFMMIKHLSTSRIETAFLAVVGLTALTLMHPAAMSAFILLLVIFIKYYDRRPWSGIQSFLLKYNLVILAATMLIAWQLTRDRLQTSVARKLVPPSTAPAADAVPIGELLQATIADFSQYLDSLIFHNPPVLIFVIGAAIYFLFLIWGRQFQQYHKPIFAFLVALTILMWLLYHFEFIIGFKPFRMVPALTMILFLPMGGLLYSISKNKKFKLKNIVTGLATLVTMFLIFSIGISTVYPSETNYQSNLQSTATELTGFHWTFNQCETDYTLTSIVLKPYRFVQFLQYDDSDGFWSDRSNASPTPPIRFGYHESDTLSNYYDEPTYLYITERDWYHDMEIYPWGLYIDLDFQRLNQDQYINRIYSGPGFINYLID